jgi:putative cardiolipin synthase
MLIERVPDDGATVRIFNPWAYRGRGTIGRAVEFMFHASRLDYRMHNKLLVVDNAIALVGGRTWTPCHAG